MADQANSCACWQTATQFSIHNYQDIVDFPLLVKNKSVLSNRCSTDTREYVLIGVKKLTYITASSNSDDADFTIPMTYKPKVRILCKQPMDHVYTTARDLVQDFPRYVTVNSYFSLHHRGVSVSAGSTLELMRVEKRCENLRGPVSFLICRYDHREIALPMETRGNFTAQQDDNLYTICDVTHKFPFPQIVKFHDDTLPLSDSLKRSLDLCPSIVTLEKQFSEEYLVGCTVLNEIVDSHSDDSGIEGSPGRLEGTEVQRTLAPDYVFMNVRSERYWWLNESVLCDSHHGLVNLGRRRFVDKVYDAVMRRPEEVQPQNPLVLTQETHAVSDASGREIMMNIPPLPHSVRGPVPSLSSPNLNLPAQRSSLVRSKTYDGGPPPRPPRSVPPLIPALSSTPPSYPTDGATLQPRDQPSVLHHIVDLPELRQRRDKTPRKSLLSRVSLSKLGQKLHGILLKEDKKKKSLRDSDDDGGFVDYARAEESPVMNNKRFQRNPAYLDESYNDSVSSDEYDHYPGIVDFTEVNLDRNTELRRSVNASRRSTLPSSYFTQLGKSSLNDSLRRNNLCPPEEKVVNVTQSSHQYYSANNNNNMNIHPSYRHSMNNGELDYSTSTTTMPANLTVHLPESQPQQQQQQYCTREPVQARSGVQSVRERNVDCDISVYSVQELTACVRARGLERIALVLERNQVDGEFFTSLTTQDFQHEPFNASPFEVKQLDRIQLGIRPRVA